METLFLSHKIIKHVQNWEEALYLVSSDALHEKVLSALYLKDVVDVVLESEIMLVINDDTVLFHARPTEHVRKECICYLNVEEGVGFFSKTLKHIFLFGAQTPERHLQLLKALTNFSMEASTNKPLFQQERMKDFFDKHR